MFWFTLVISCYLLVIPFGINTYNWKTRFFYNSLPIMLGVVLMFLSLSGLGLSQLFGVE